MQCEVFYTKFPVFCRRVREIFFPHEGEKMFGLVGVSTPFSGSKSTA